MALATGLRRGRTKGVCFAQNIDGRPFPELEQNGNIRFDADMYVCSCLAASGAFEAGAGLARRNLGRDHLRLAAGRGGVGISSGGAARRAGAVGAGPADQTRGRGTVPAGHRAGAVAGRSVPSCRCPDSNGGRAVQPRLYGGGGRDMGRSGGAGFHGDAQAGHAGRGGGAFVLAAASGGVRPGVGGADAVAGGGLPLGSGGGRSCRTGRSLLAGGTVQVAPVASGGMAGAP